MPAATRPSVSAFRMRGLESRKSRPTASVFLPRRRMYVPKARPMKRTASSVRSRSCRPRMSYSRKICGLTALALMLSSRGCGPVLGAALGLRLVSQVGVDEAVDIAVQDTRRVRRLRARPVILDQRVGLQHVRADLASEVDVLLGPGDAGETRLLDLQLMRVEPRLEDAHGELAVSVLAALGLRRHGDAGGQVGDANRRLGLVDVLPARSRGAERVHAQILVVDVHFDRLVDRGEHGDRGE